MIPRKRILVVQQINRAYRVPLLRKIASNPIIDLTVVYGTSQPVQEGDIGITVAKGEMPFKTIKGPIEGIRYKGREILWFGLSLKCLKNDFYDLVICDYYTRLLSVWPMQSIQHRRNAGFILWGIGFNQYPTPLLDKVRLLMVKRSDAVILYSHKEYLRYINMGVNQEKFFVANNTVDIEGIDASIFSANKNKIQECKNTFKSENSVNNPVLIHVGRLAENKRLDIIIKALPELEKRWPNLKLVLIGEGPMRDSLVKLAHNLGVSESLLFLGPITDHKVLAPWILASDLFIAPGQVGLMAPMALAYEKSLVISDKEELHGPEVQVFIPGKTGLTYKYDRIDDLVNKIDFLLKNPTKRKEFEKFGSAFVRKTMGPEKMHDAFLSAIDYVTSKKATNI